MKAFVPGDSVEIVDPSHRLYRRVGTVAYLVGDNVYVRFPRVRWHATRILFPQQLRLAQTTAVER